MVYQNIIKELNALENPIKSGGLSRFFKTGPGQYGEGDRFLGITVPVTRSIVKKYIMAVTLIDIEGLLNSPIHEIRLAGVIFLVKLFEKARPQEQETIFHFYLDHTDRINNWDLVDVSAPNIVWAYLLDKDKGTLYELAHSKNLWERRISIISTLYFIKKGEYNTTFSIIETLLSDKHDLIHKANGWMLREIGKQCGEEVLESFLLEYYHTIPRTTLRYAIERMDTERKRYWMKYNCK